MEFAPGAKLFDRQWIIPTGCGLSLSLTGISIGDLRLGPPQGKQLNPKRLGRYISPLKYRQIASGIVKKIGFPWRKPDPVEERSEK
jgi:hypothetical protein